MKKKIISALAILLLSTPVFADDMFNISSYQAEALNYNGNLFGIQALLKLHGEGGQLALIYFYNEDVDLPENFSDFGTSGPRFFVHEHLSKYSIYRNMLKNYASINFVFQTNSKNARMRIPDSTPVGQ